MKALFLRFTLILPLALMGCHEKSKEEVDYDQLVDNAEEGEWTSAPDCEERQIAGELYPEPQETLLDDSIDTPYRLDTSTLR